MGTFFGVKLTYFLDLYSKKITKIHVKIPVIKQVLFEIKQMYGRDSFTSTSSEEIICIAPYITE